MDIRSRLDSLGVCIPTQVGPDTFYRQFVIGAKNPETSFNLPSLNALGSLGNFRLDVEISGQLHKQWEFLGLSQTAADLNLHLVVLDKFDFHPGEHVPFTTKPSLFNILFRSHQIPDDWAHELAWRGYAQNFFIRGDTDVKFTSTPLARSSGNVPPDNWVPAACIGMGFFSPGECAPPPSTP